MNDMNLEKKTSWKNWLIKKLISSEASKEEVLNFIARDDEDKKTEKLYLKIIYKICR